MKTDETTSPCPIACRPAAPLVECTQMPLSLQHRVVTGRSWVSMIRVVDNICKIWFRSSMLVSRYDTAVFSKPDSNTCQFSYKRNVNMYIPYFHYPASNTGSSHMIIWFLRLQIKQYWPCMYEQDLYILNVPRSYGQGDTSVVMRINPCIPIFQITVMERIPWNHRAGQIEPDAVIAPGASISLVLSGVSKHCLPPNEEECPHWAVDLAGDYGGCGFICRSINGYLYIVCYERHLVSRQPFRHLSPSGTNYVIIDRVHSRTPTECQWLHKRYFTIETDIITHSVILRVYKYIVHRSTNCIDYRVLIFMSYYTNDKPYLYFFSLQVIIRCSNTRRRLIPTHRMENDTYKDEPSAYILIDPISGTNSHDECYHIWQSSGGLGCVCIPHHTGYRVANGSYCNCIYTLLSDIHANDTNILCVSLTNIFLTPLRRIVCDYYVLTCLDKLIFILNYQLSYMYIESLCFDSLQVNILCQYYGRCHDRVQRWKNHHLYKLLTPEEISYYNLMAGQQSGLRENRLYGYPGRDIYSYLTDRTTHARYYVPIIRTERSRLLCLNTIKDNLMIFSELPRSLPQWLPQYVIIVLHYGIRVHILIRCHNNRNNRIAVYVRTENVCMQMLLDNHICSIHSSSSDAILDLNLTMSRMTFLYDWLDTTLDVTHRYHTKEPLREGPCLRQYNTSLKRRCSHFFAIFSVNYICMMSKADQTLAYGRWSCFSEPDGRAKFVLALKDHGSLSSLPLWYQSHIAGSDQHCSYFDGLLCPCVLYINYKSNHERVENSII